MVSLPLTRSQVRVTKLFQSRCYLGPHPYSGWCAVTRIQFFGFPNRPYLDLLSYISSALSKSLGQSAAAPPIRHSPNVKMSLRIAPSLGLKQPVMLGRHDASLEFHS